MPARIRVTIGDELTERRMIVNKGDLFDFLDDLFNYGWLLVDPLPLAGDRLGRVVQLKPLVFRLYVDEQRAMVAPIGHVADALSNDLGTLAALALEDHLGVDELAAIGFIITVDSISSMTRHILDVLLALKAVDALPDAGDSLLLPI